MTELEKRLARRIHNQRSRLRELEDFSRMHRESKVWSRSMWLHMAMKLLRENERLRARLGITEHFNQRGSLIDHAP
jgi:hypothetical protein